MNTMTISQAIWTLVGAVCACAFAVGVLWIREAEPEPCALPWGHYGMPTDEEMRELYPPVPVVEAVPVPVAVAVVLP